MILLSGLIGALVGAFAALASQFLANYLAEQRDRRRFQIQSFERFRSEFSEDENLRRISIKKEAMTDDELTITSASLKKWGSTFRGVWLIFSSWTRYRVTRSSMHGIMWL